MKNKKFTYLLIVCVAAVWGIIFYRIFAATPKDETLLSAGSGLKKSIGEDVYTIQDTFTLALNYRDPFLDEAAEPAEAVEEISTVTIAQPVASPVKPPINWDFIKYGGYIINPRTKKVVSIITINGREQMADEGAKMPGGVKLIKNYRDSIKVSYQDKVKFIILK